MGVVSIYALLRHSGKVPYFHGENPATCHLTFVVKIRHRFVFDDMDCDNHIGGGGGASKYIYKYNMHIYSTQKRKVNANNP